MLIDCQTCAAPEGACGDCVVAVLLRRPPRGATAAGTGAETGTDNGAAARVTGGSLADLDAQECAALDILADAGLVPPLRLVPLLAGQESPARRRARRPA